MPIFANIFSSASERDPFYPLSLSIIPIGYGPNIPLQNKFFFFKFLTNRISC